MDRSTTLLFLWLSGSVLAAQEPSANDPYQELEERVRELEASKEESPSDWAALPEWFERVRLSGSANVGYFDGQDDSIFSAGAFNVWDARFFLEADLGRDVSLGEQVLLRDIGFLFEWNLVRVGTEENDVGELYVDFQGVLDSPWLNLQVGRFQLPLGENYLRFSRGYKDNPFVSNTLGGPWWWDEGIRFYGSGPTSPIGYVASVSNGDTPFNSESQENKQLTLKIFADPTDWLHLSASGLRSGRIGSSTSPAFAALWQGESFPTSFGLLSGVPNFDNGVAVPDGPNQLDGVTFLGVDAVLSSDRDLARLWLAYGVTDIDSEGPSLYDRSLKYWVAELILRGGLVSEPLDPFYLGLRAEGYGTYDGNEGYLLDLRYASSLGYNMKSFESYSIVLGWNITEHVTLRAQHSFQDIDLVRGVTPNISAAAGSPNYSAVEIGVHF